jgi:polar amino acid transport system permease protein
MLEFLLGPETAQLLAMDSWGGALWRGLLATLQIAAGGYGLGILIGIAGAFGKLYGGPIVRDLLEIYTTIVRAVPELVLILLLYYAGNSLINLVLGQFGVGPIEISGLVAGIYVIGIVQGAYTTEVIRGAINAIPAGQIEAARSFGMPPMKVLRRITLPAMLPYALPGLANLWLIATKDTALLSIVGFSELTLATKQAAGATKAYFTFYTVAAGIYLAVTIISMRGIRWLEKRSRRGLPAMGG